MLSRVILAALLSTTVGSGAALAQSKPSPDDSMKGSSAGQQQPLPQQVRTKLKDQGFTDVKVVPGSLLVSAKDKQGDPVTMVIGPHSMAIFTVSSSDESSTVGSSAARGDQPGDP
ncbi:MAG: hypothetical protein K5821_15920 [Nitrobacter sp.]|nr:hypothetical protein [Nitrobacter sp.]